MKRMGLIMFTRYSCLTLVLNIPSFDSSCSNVNLMSKLKESANGIYSRLFLHWRINMRGDMKKISVTWLTPLDFGCIIFGFSVRWVNDYLYWTLKGQFLNSEGSGHFISLFYKYSGASPKIPSGFSNLRSMLVMGTFSSHSCIERLSNWGNRWV